MVLKAMPSCHGRSPNRCSHTTCWLPATLIQPRSTLATWVAAPSSTTSFWVARGAETCLRSQGAGAEPQVLVGNRLHDCGLSLFASEDPTVGAFGNFVDIQAYLTLTEMAGNTVGDPGLKPDGIHLQEDSPLVNAGEDATPETRGGVMFDYDGDARPGGVGADIGPDEI